MGVTKFIGEKKPASHTEGGADLGSISGVFPALSSCLLVLGLGERLGDSSDLTLFFLAFLPGAGESVGVTTFTKPPLFQSYRLIDSSNPTFESHVGGKVL